MRASKILFFTGIAFFITQAILSLFFYKERLVLPDCANYLFDLVSNGGHMAIFHHRFIAGATQILPYFAIKANSSLATVAKLYSLNMALFPLICFLLCFWPKPNPKAALLLLLSQSLVSTEVFFWMVTEINQALALACVGMAWLTWDEEPATGPPWLFAGFLSLITLCLAFAHPLVLIAVAFMLLYLFWSFPERRRVLFLFGALYAISLVIQTLSKDIYEGKALGGLRNFVKLFPDYFSTPALERFLGHSLGAYFWLCLGFVGVLIYYALKKDYWKAMTFFAACTGYLMLVTVCFPDYPGYEFYQESLYLVLAFFVAVPLAFEVLPAFQNRQIAHLITAIVLATAIFRIVQKQAFFAEKLDWKRAMIREYSGRKIILDEKNFSNKNWFMVWSLPFEFWLLSTVEQQSTASIVVCENPESYREKNGPRVFLTPFWTYRYEDLPARYFQFADTTRQYEWDE